MQVRAVADQVGVLELEFESSVVAAHGVQLVEQAERAGLGCVAVLGHVFGGKVSAVPPVTRREDLAKDELPAVTRRIGRQEARQRQRLKLRRLLAPAAGALPSRLLDAGRAAGAAAARALRALFRITTADPTRRRAAGREIFTHDAARGQASTLPRVSAALRDGGAGRNAADVGRVDATVRAVGAGVVRGAAAVRAVAGAVRKHP